MKKVLFWVITLLGLAGLCFPVFAQSAPAQRVVTVGAPVTEIVFALGGGDQVIATDTTSMYPEAVGALPKVGYMRTLSTEGILGLKPDLVLALDTSGPAQVLDEIRNLGAKVVVLPSLARLENLPDAITIVANALGLSEEGGSLAKATRDKIENLKATKLAEKAKAPKIVFLMSVGHQQPMAAGAHTTASEIIDLLGGINTMAEYDGFKPVSPEVIASDDADYVLMSDYTLAQLGGLKGVQANQVLGLHKAIAQGHILTVSSSTILGFGPRSVDEIKNLKVTLENDRANSQQVSQ